jgi:hypothetical protein
MTVTMIVTIVTLDRHHDRHFAVGVTIDYQ